MRIDELNSNLFIFILKAYQNFKSKSSNYFQLILLYSNCTILLGYFLTREKSFFILSFNAIINSMAKVIFMDFRAINGMDVGLVDSTLEFCALWFRGRWQMLGHCKIGKWVRESKMWRVKRERERSLFFLENDSPLRRTVVSRGFSFGAKDVFDSKIYVNPLGIVLDVDISLTCRIQIQNIETFFGSFGISREKVFLSFWTTSKSLHTRTLNKFNKSSPPLIV